MAWLPAATKPTPTVSHRLLLRLESPHDPMTLGMHMVCTTLHMGFQLFKVRETSPSLIASHILAYNLNCCNDFLQLFPYSIFNIQRKEAEPFHSVLPLTPTILSHSRCHVNHFFENIWNISFVSVRAVKHRPTLIPLTKFSKDTIPYVTYAKQKSTFAIFH